MPFDVKTFTKFFFDRAAVTSAIDAGTRRALSKFGAYVRTRSRSSIKKAPMADPRSGRILRGRRRKGQQVRPAVAKPGRPPYAHTGLLRRFIFFGLDPNARSVVAGPALAGSKSGAPAVLEHGGIGHYGKHHKPAVYEPRPYMRPAFAAELPKVPQLFKDAIRR